MGNEIQAPGQLDPRTYAAAECVVFRKTAESFGGLSNMAPGFPLLVNGIEIGTSEALYQACRFPMDPKLQEMIFAERSPMTAKMRTKPHRARTRPDWDEVKVRIMRWCLRVKLAQNWQKFSALLEATGERPIVESSRKDPYWGAQPQEGGLLVGANVLGRLLMELRGWLREPDKCHSLREVEPPSMPHALLLGWPIERVTVTHRPSSDLVNSDLCRCASTLSLPLSGVFPEPRGHKSS